MQTTKRKKPAGRTGASSAPVPSRRSESRYDDRSRALFDALRTSAGDTIELDALTSALKESGIRMDDPRLADVRAAMEGLGGANTVSFEQFDRIKNGNPFFLTFGPMTFDVMLYFLHNTCLCNYSNNSS